jgi:hypothetical protein
MRNVCLKTLVLALTLVGLAGVALRTDAQTIQTLIQFTNSWQYDQTGRQLPANWMSSAYVPDGQWGPSSPGLLGFEPDTPGVYTAHAPILTPLVNSGSITTYYFRTTFNYAGSLANVSLIATNLVDDGCAIYLNGLRVGGVRIPAGYNALNAATFFAGGTEGALEVVTFTNLSALRVGANLLAVEVHQSANPSSDNMFGMKLLSIAPSALQITSQPQSQTAVVGDAVTFSVGVSGGPVTYRWFKDNVLQSSTSNTLAIASVQVASAGNYQVIVSNILGAVSSTVATLTVVADLEGPEMLEAIINNVPSGGGSSFGTNTINVIFDEPLNATTARNTNNYQLVSATNSSIRVPILSILYSTALGVLLNVDGTNVNWKPTGEYHLIVNNVADTRGNLIAPNSIIGVSILITTNLTQMIDVWDFYAISFFDPTYPDIYRNAGAFATNPWYGTNFVVDYSSGLWGFGAGILYVDPNPPPAQVCAGDTPQTLISYQNQPTLFRRKFTLPAGVPTSGTFRFRFVYDDGIVIYLNGVEVHRRNMPAGPLNELTLASTPVTDFGCTTNLVLDVTGLNVGRGGNALGTNVIAAAVYQSATPESDTWFGLEMDLVTLRTPAVPPPARLTMSRQACALRISWPTNLVGYTLQSKTNLNPSVPWVQVPNQSNPYTNLNSCVGNRFFRLFKP